MLRFTGIYSYVKLHGKERSHTWESISLDLSGPVHPYPDIFESAIFFFALPYVSGFTLSSLTNL